MEEVAEEEAGTDWSHLDGFSGAQVFRKHLDITNEPLARIQKNNYNVKIENILGSPWDH